MRTPSLDIDSYLGAAARPTSRLGHGGLGAAQLRADPAAHELEAGDRHLPRALPLPLPASRAGSIRCSSTTSRPTSTWDRTSRFAAAKRTLTELEGRRKESWRIPDHAIVLYATVPQHRAGLHPGSLRRVHQLPGLARRVGDALLGAGPSRRRRPGSPTAIGKPTSTCSPRRWSRISASARPSSATAARGANRQQTFGKFEKALGWYHAEIDRAIA